MNLDELQSVQSRERQASEIQDLRPSFYSDAVDFVRRLREKRQRIVHEKGLDAPEFERLTDDINTAERTIESIYERRVGKIVNRASIAAAEMPTGDTGLTQEEQALFETLVADIEANREQILASLSDATSDEPANPSQVTSSGGETGTELDEPSDESDADPRMTEDPDTGSDTEPSGGPDEPQLADQSDPRHFGADNSGQAEEESGRDTHASADTGGDGPPSTPAEETTSVDRMTIRITRNVGEIFCVDQRAYHLASEDVVTLPAANAEPLVERGAAERIN